MQSIEATNVLKLNGSRPDRDDADEMRIIGRSVSDEVDPPLKAEIDVKLAELRAKYQSLIECAAQYRKWAQEQGNSSKYGRFYLECARKLEREAAALLLIN